MKKNLLLLSILLCFTVFFSACAVGDSLESTRDLSAPLPPPEPDGGPFGVDVNINMNTIDDFLDRPDVAYFDMRMFYDPADFAAIGGIAELTRTLPGYRVVPYPFLGTLSAMPVSYIYEGDSLFKILWDDDYNILELSANYLESEIILNEIFPRDKVIFLMCGGGGYSALTRSLLIYHGWDENMIYNTGANWQYEGNMSVDMTLFGDESNIATWRANYAYIDFNRLHRITP